MRDHRLVELEYFKRVAGELYQVTYDAVSRAGDDESDDGRGFGSFRGELRYCMVNMGADLDELRRNYSDWAESVAIGVVARLTAAEKQLLWVKIECDREDGLPEQQSSFPSLPSEGEVRTELIKHFGDSYLHLVYIEEHPTPKW